MSISNFSDLSITSASSGEDVIATGTESRPQAQVPVALNSESARTAGPASVNSAGVSLPSAPAAFSSELASPALDAELGWPVPGSLGTPGKKDQASIPSSCGEASCANAQASNQPSMASRLTPPGPHDSNTQHINSIPYSAVDNRYRFILDAEQFFAALALGGDE